MLCFMGFLWVYGFYGLTSQTTVGTTAAANRVITKTSISEHIFNVLQNLHWLPVKFHVNFEILLLTYKALNN